MEENPAFLVVIETNGKFFVALTNERGSIEHSIQAYDSKEELLDAFSDFVRFGVGSYENAMSGTIAMIQINPKAIKCTLNELTPFVLEQSVHRISSMAIAPIMGMPVSKNILKYHQFDIFHEVQMQIEEKLGWK